MTLAGTLLNVKRLSWDGTKKRADEVIKAREKVRSRPTGVIPGITGPVYVASLLDEMRAKNEGKVDWLTWLRAEVAEYREIRRGKRVELQNSITASLRKA